MSESALIPAELEAIQAAMRDASGPHATTRRLPLMRADHLVAQAKPWLLALADAWAAAAPRRLLPMLPGRWQLRVLSVDVVDGCDAQQDLVGAWFGAATVGDGAACIVAVHGPIIETIAAARCGDARARVPSRRPAAAAARALFEPVGQALLRSWLGAWNRDDGGADALWPSEPSDGAAATRSAAATGAGAPGMDCDAVPRARAAEASDAAPRAGDDARADERSNELSDELSDAVPCALSEQTSRPARTALPLRDVVAADAATGPSRAPTGGAVTGWPPPSRARAAATSTAERGAAPAAGPRLRRELRVLLDGAPPALAPLLTAESLVCLSLAWSGDLLGTCHLYISANALLPPEEPDLEESAPQRALELLAQVAVEVRVELGSRPTSPSELAALRPGATLALSSSVAAPVPIFVGGVLKAWGTPVLRGGALAVAVAELVDGGAP